MPIALEWMVRVMNGCDADDTDLLVFTIFYAPVENVLDDALKAEIDLLHLSPLLV
jgi:hypothetical protein